MKLLRATSVEMFSYLGEREKKNLQAVRMIQSDKKKKKKKQSVVFIGRAWSGFKEPSLFSHNAPSLILIPLKSWQRAGQ